MHQQQHENYAVPAPQLPGRPRFQACSDWQQLPTTMSREQAWASSQGQHPRSSAASLGGLAGSYSMPPAPILNGIALPSELGALAQSRPLVAQPAYLPHAPASHPDTANAPCTGLGLDGFNAVAAAHLSPADQQPTAGVTYPAVSAAPASGPTRSTSSGAGTSSDATTRRTATPPPKLRMPRHAVGSALLHTPCFGAPSPDSSSLGSDEDVDRQAALSKQLSLLWSTEADVYSAESRVERLESVRFHPFDVRTRQMQPAQLWKDLAFSTSGSVGRPSHVVPEEGVKLPITLSAAVTDITNQLSMWKEEAQRHKQLLQEQLDKLRALAGEPLRLSRTLDAMAGGVSVWDLGHNGGIKPNMQSLDLLKELAVMGELAPTATVELKPPGADTAVTFSLAAAQELHQHLHYYQALAKDWPDGPPDLQQMLPFGETSCCWLLHGSGSSTAVSISQLRTGLQMQQCSLVQLVYHLADPQRRALWAFDLVTLNALNKEYTQRQSAGIGGISALLASHQQQQEGAAPLAPQQQEQQALQPPAAQVAASAQASRPAAVHSGAVPHFSGATWPGEMLPLACSRPNLEASAAFAMPELLMQNLPGGQQQQQQLQQLPMSGPQLQQAMPWSQPQLPKQQHQEMLLVRREQQLLQNMQLREQLGQQEDQLSHDLGWQQGLASMPFDGHPPQQEPVQMLWQQQHHHQHRQGLFPQKQAVRPFGSKQQKQQAAAPQVPALSRPQDLGLPVVPAVSAGQRQRPQQHEAQLPLGLEWQQQLATLQDQNDDLQQQSQHEQHGVLAGNMQQQQQAAVQPVAAFVQALEHWPQAAPVLSGGQSHSHLSYRAEQQLQAQQHQQQQQAGVSPALELSQGQGSGLQPAPAVLSSPSYLQGQYRAEQQAQGGQGRSHVTPTKQRPQQQAQQQAAALAVPVLSPAQGARLPAAPALSGGHEQAREPSRVQQQLQRQLGRSHAPPPKQQQTKIQPHLQQQVQERRLHASPAVSGGSTQSQEGYRADGQLQRQQLRSPQQQQVQVQQAPYHASPKQQQQQRQQPMAPPQQQKQAVQVQQAQQQVRQQEAQAQQVRQQQQPQAAQVQQQQQQKAAQVQQRERQSVLFARMFLQSLEKEREEQGIDEPLAPDVQQAIEMLLRTQQRLQRDNHQQQQQQQEEEEVEGGYEHEQEQQGTLAVPPPQQLQLRQQVVRAQLVEDPLQRGRQELLTQPQESSPLAQLQPQVPQPGAPSLLSPQQLGEKQPMQGGLQQQPAQGKQPPAPQQNPQRVLQSPPQQQQESPQQQQQSILCKQPRVPPQLLQQQNLQSVPLLAQEQQQQQQQQEFQQQQLQHMLPPPAVPVAAVVPAEGSEHQPCQQPFSHKKLVSPAELQHAPQSMPLPAQQQQKRGWGYAAKRVQWQRGGKQQHCQRALQDIVPQQQPPVPMHTRPQDHAVLHAQQQQQQQQQQEPPTQAPLQQQDAQGIHGPQLPPQLQGLVSTSEQQQWLLELLRQDKQAQGAAGNMQATLLHALQQQQQQQQAPSRQLGLLQQEQQCQQAPQLAPPEEQVEMPARKRQRRQHQQQQAEVLELPQLPQQQAQEDPSMGQEPHPGLIQDAGLTQPEEQQQQAQKSWSRQHLQQQQQQQQAKGLRSAQQMHVQHNAEGLQRPQQQLQKQQKAAGQQPARQLQPQQQQRQHQGQDPRSGQPLLLHQQQHPQEIHESSLRLLEPQPQPQQAGGLHPAQKPRGWGYAAKRVQWQNKPADNLRLAQKQQQKGLKRSLHAQVQAKQQAQDLLIQQQQQQQADNPHLAQQLLQQSEDQQQQQQEAENTRLAQQLQQQTEDQQPANQQQQQQPQQQQAEESDLYFDEDLQLLLQEGDDHSTPTGQQHGLATQQQDMSTQQQQQQQQLQQQDVHNQQQQQQQPPLLQQPGQAAGSELAAQQQQQQLHSSPAEQQKRQRQPLLQQSGHEVQGEPAAQQQQQLHGQQQPAAGVRGSQPVAHDPVPEQQLSQPLTDGPMPPDMHGRRPRAQEQPQSPDKQQQQQQQSPATQQQSPAKQQQQQQQSKRDGQRSALPQQPPAVPNDQPSGQQQHALQLKALQAKALQNLQQMQRQQQRQQHHQQKPQQLQWQQQQWQPQQQEPQQRQLQLQLQEQQQQLGQVVQELPSQKHNELPDLPQQLEAHSVLLSAQQQQQQQEQQQDELEEGELLPSQQDDPPALPQPLPQQEVPQELLPPQQQQQQQQQPHQQADREPLSTQQYDFDALPPLLPEIELPPVLLSKQQQQQQQQQQPQDPCQPVSLSQQEAMPGPQQHEQHLPGMQHVQPQPHPGMPGTVEPERQRHQMSPQQQQQQQQQEFAAQPSGVDAQQQQPQQPQSAAQPQVPRVQSLDPSQDPFLVIMQQYLRLQDKGVEHQSMLLELQHVFDQLPPEQQQSKLLGVHTALQRLQQSLMESKSEKERQRLQHRLGLVEGLYATLQQVLHSREQQQHQQEQQAAAAGEAPPSAETAALQEQAEEQEMLHQMLQLFQQDEVPVQVPGQVPAQVQVQVEGSADGLVRVQVSGSKPAAGAAAAGATTGNPSPPGPVTPPPARLSGQGADGGALPAEFSGGIDAAEAEGMLAAAEADAGTAAAAGLAGDADLQLRGVSTGPADTEEILAAAAAAADAVTAAAARAVAEFAGGGPAADTAAAARPAEQPAQETAPVPNHADSELTVSEEQAHQQQQQLTGTAAAAAGGGQAPQSSVPQDGHPAAQLPPKAKGRRRQRARRDMATESASQLGLDVSQLEGDAATSAMGLQEQQQQQQADVPASIPAPAKRRGRPPSRLSQQARQQVQQHQQQVQQAPASSATAAQEPPQAGVPEQGTEQSPNKRRLSLGKRRKAQDDATHSAPPAPAPAPVPATAAAAAAGSSGRRGPGRPPVRGNIRGSSPAADAAPPAKRQRRQASKGVNALTHLEAVAEADCWWDSEADAEAASAEESDTEDSAYDPVEEVADAAFAADSPPSWITGMDWEQLVPDLLVPASPDFQGPLHGGHAAGGEQQQQQPPQQQQQPSQHQQQQLSGVAPKSSQRQAGAGRQQRANRTGPKTSPAKQQPASAAAHAGSPGQRRAANTAGPLPPAPAAQGWGGVGGTAGRQRQRLARSEQKAAGSHALGFQGGHVGYMMAAEVPTEPLAKYSVPECLMPVDSMQKQPQLQALQEGVQQGEQSAAEHSADTALPNTQRRVLQPQPAKGGTASVASPRPQPRIRLKGASAGPGVGRSSGSLAALPAQEVQSGNDSCSPEHDPPLPAPVAAAPAAPAAAAAASATDAAQGSSSGGTAVQQQGWPLGSLPAAAVRPAVVAKAKASSGDDSDDDEPLQIVFRKRPRTVPAAPAPAATAAQLPAPATSVAPAATTSAVAAQQRQIAQFRAHAVRSNPKAAVVAAAAVASAAAAARTGVPARMPPLPAGCSRATDVGTLRKLLVQRRQQEGYSSGLRQALLRRERLSAPATAAAEAGVQYNVWGRYVSTYALPFSLLQPLKGWTWKPQAVIKHRGSNPAPTSAKRSGASASSSQRTALRARSARSQAPIEGQSVAPPAKKVVWQRSSIHGAGLFAGERIAAGEFVIEYKGVLIRPVLEDVVEQRYESQGQESSYLFRIDKNRVADASVSGGLARFINHSCDPNCYTKVFLVNGVARMGIYAKRAIQLGEELAYDYKFDFEEGARRVPCHCGARNCRGYMN